jgi:transcriptional regulator with XRE-family HTH domain
MESTSKTLIEFGNRVRQLRKEKKLSQEELAHRADLHRKSRKKHHSSKY